MNNSSTLNGMFYSSYVINMGLVAPMNVINATASTSYPQYLFIPLEELQRHCSPSAAFNSAARFDPPRCAESTRLQIIQLIQNWIDSDKDDSSLFWLHGGVGVGKSALAQSLSEAFNEKGQLAASFFFFRSDATRNNGDHLIPTLVSHLLHGFKGIVPFVRDRLRINPAIFAKDHQLQIQELLIEPLVALKLKTGDLGTHPRLIVIDGLDECQNPDIQCELLRAIARAIPHIPYPLRFFITSRPEAHIVRAFNHDPDLLAIPVHRYNLSNDPDADMDIRKFLENEFAEIRRCGGSGYLPHAWPDRNAITSLVERSSGHFIYASTVIKYIRSPKHRPDDRLEIVLRPRPPQEGDQPYAQLDALYTLIFAGVEDRSQLEKICLVLGILYFQSRKVSFFVTVPVYPNIEELLEMKAGDLFLLLGPISPLIAVDGDTVHILHQSLFDYLLDSTRGGHLAFDLARVHEIAATYILKHRILEDVCDLGYFRHFAYHCRYAYLNDTLKGYLQSLEVPFPKSLLTTLGKTFPPWGDDLNSSLRLTVWNFFRTLSREDFDSTGEVHKKYAAKWATYLHSAIPRRTLRQGRTIFAKVGDWKSKLDKLLTEWKPPDIGPMNVGRDLDRHVSFIKQEHRVFLAYDKAAFSGDTKAMTSSLIFGDHFIHNYSFGIWGERSFGFLTLHTYSRDAYSYHVRVGYLDVVQETLDYQGTVEKYLLSGVHNKYGIELDEDDKPNEEL